MSYRPDESTWISYLHGELSEAERKQVEEYLKTNDCAREEVEALRDTAGILGKLKDQEVEVPTFSFSNTSKIVVADRGRTSSLWKYPLSMAASLALLLLAGYLTSFKAAYKNGGFEISFGGNEKQVIAEPTFSEDQVKALIADALDANRRETDQKISTVNNELKQSISSIDKGELDRQLLDDYLMQLRLLNSELVGDMMEEAAWDQRRYTDQVIQDLAIYLDLQRQEDMNIIQTRFENLSDDTEFNRSQTNQILSTFLTDAQEPQNQY